MLESRLSYSPITARAPWRLPGGARVAFWIVPNIEHYEYLPPPHAQRNAYPRTPHPDVLTYGQKDFGNRVGLWRMFELLDAHGLRATVSLNIAAFEHYPIIFEQCEKRRWDYMGHGLYNTRYLWGASEEEERSLITECVDTFRRWTGRQLGGWLSPALSHTPWTPDLVAEAGIGYYCDWAHDDQPTELAVQSGSLVTVPYSIDLNDAVVYRQGFEADDFARMIKDTFDTLYREGAESGRVMCIAVHPYNMGQPHRLRYLDEALSYILQHDGVWPATGQEIADCYRATLSTGAHGAS